MLRRTSNLDAQTMATIFFCGLSLKVWSVYRGQISIHNTKITPTNPMFRPQYRQLITPSASQDPFYNTTIL